jgi:UDP-N-acetylglucosamine 1-carboxyvinyltransferase
VSGILILNKSRTVIWRIYMEKFIVGHTDYLCGDVDISGSKNAVLPIIAAALLVGEKCTLFNVPKLSDVRVMLNLLEKLGCTVSYDGTLTLDCKNVNTYRVNADNAKSIRASFLISGALLGRLGKAIIPLPGGCSIGLRPVDLHLKGFLGLGAKYNLEHGTADISATKLKGAQIYLDFPSVGATENIILAAVKADGITVLNNCATEPEIVDMTAFLNKCGAKIYGSGTDTIKIEGVKNLHGCEHTIMPDRIEAGTFMLATAATGGKVKIKNVIPGHIRAVTAKLREIGISVTEGENFVSVTSNGKYSNTDIKTLPFPGFPTDMQAQFMSLMTKGSGTGIINETVFENRFMQVGELIRMGADIKIEGRSAVINGVKRLTGTKVNATDLRAGAGLVISALLADGMTEIGEIHYIDRGYEAIDKKLRALGADIRRA